MCRFIQLYMYCHIVSNHLTFRPAGACLGFGASPRHRFGDGLENVFWYVILNSFGVILGADPFVNRYGRDLVIPEMGTDTGLWFR